MSPIHPKVAGFTVAGSLVVILVWALSLAKVQVPGDVSAAMTTLIGAVIAYYVPSADQPPANPPHQP